MKNSIYILFVIVVCLLLSACTTKSYIYVHNKTEHNITISYFDRYTHEVELLPDSLYLLDIIYGKTKNGLINGSNVSIPKNANITKEEKIITVNFVDCIDQIWQNKLKKEKINWITLEITDSFFSKKKE